MNTVNDESEKDRLIFVSPSDVKGFMRGGLESIDNEIFTRVVHAAGIDIFQYTTLETESFFPDVRKFAWEPLIMAPVRPVLDGIKDILAKVGIRKYGVNLYAWVGVRGMPHWRIECVIEITPESITLRRL